MKLSWNCIKVTAVAAAAALAFGNPAAAKEDPLTVALITNISDFHTVKPLVDKWTKETGHPVKVIEESTETYLTNYILAARTGTPKIDVVYFWDYSTGSLYHFLTPLDGSADSAVKLSKTDEDDFMKPFLDPYAGHLYSIPYSIDVRLLYYRTDLFKKAGITEAPKTWDQLMADAKALTKDTNGDGVVDQWGFVSVGKPAGFWNISTFTDFLVQAGGHLFVEGKPTFDSPAGVKALQFYVDLYNSVMPADATTFTSSNIHTGFLNGSFAMANHWPYMQGMIEKSNLAGKTGYALEPIPPGGVHGTMTNTWGFGIMKNSTQKKLAFDFIKYMTSTQSGIYEFSKQQDYSARKSVYASPDAKAQVPASYWEFSQFVAKVMQGNQPVRPPSQQAAQLLLEQIDKALHREVTPQQALDAAKKGIEALPKA